MSRFYVYGIGGCAKRFYDTIRGFIKIDAFIYSDERGCTGDLVTAEGGQLHCIKFSEFLSDLNKVPKEDAMNLTDFEAEGYDVTLSIEVLTVLPDWQKALLWMMNINDVCEYPLSFA